MEKKTIIVEGQRAQRSLTGITICLNDKSNYHEFLRKLPEDARLKITIEVSDPRQAWIDDWYNRAKTAEDNGCAFIKYCRDTTIVVAYGTECLNEIGLSAPRHNDKYDRKTGIAVAYAKTVGAIVPNFI